MDGSADYWLSRFDQVLHTCFYHNGNVQKDHPHVQAKMSLKQMCLENIFENRTELPLLLIAESGANNVTYTNLVHTSKLNTSKKDELH